MPLLEILDRATEIKQTKKEADVQFALATGVRRTCWMGACNSFHQPTYLFNE